MSKQGDQYREEIRRINQRVRVNYVFWMLDYASRQQDINFLQARATGQSYPSLRLPAQELLDFISDHETFVRTLKPGDCVQVMKSSCDATTGMVGTYDGEANPCESYIRVTLPDDPKHPKSIRVNTRVLFPPKTQPAKQMVQEKPSQPVYPQEQDPTAAVRALLTEQNPSYEERPMGRKKGSKNRKPPTGRNNTPTAASESSSPTTPESELPAPVVLPGAKRGPKKGSKKTNPYQSGEGKGTTVHTDTNTRIRRSSADLLKDIENQLILGSFWFLPKVKWNAAIKQLVKLQEQEQTRANATAALELINGRMDCMRRIAIGVHVKLIEHYKNISVLSTGVVRHIGAHTASVLFDGTSVWQTIPLSLLSPLDEEKSSAVQESVAPPAVSPESSDALNGTGSVSVPSHGTTDGDPYLSVPTLVTDMGNIDHQGTPVGSSDQEQPVSAPETLSESTGGIPWRPVDVSVPTDEDISDAPTPGSQDPVTPVPEERHVTALIPVMSEPMTHGFFEEWILIKDPRVFQEGFLFAKPYADTRERIIYRVISAKPVGRKSLDLHVIGWGEQSHIWNLDRMIRWNPPALLNQGSDFYYLTPLEYRRVYQEYLDADPEALWFTAVEFLGRIFSILQMYVKANPGFTRSKQFGDFAKLASIYLCDPPTFEMLVQWVAQDAPSPDVEQILAKFRSLLMISDQRPVVSSAFEMALASATRRKLVNDLLAKISGMPEMTDQDLLDLTRQLEEKMK